MASIEATILGFSLTFPYIWSCPAIATSIRVYRTVVHVQNGAAVTLGARRASRGGRDRVQREWPSSREVAARRKTQSSGRAWDLKARPPGNAERGCRRVCRADRGAAAFSGQAVPDPPPPRHPPPPTPPTPAP